MRLLQQFAYLCRKIDESISTLSIKEKVKLIEQRKAKGLSQSEIADKLCMEVTAYCRREKGQVKIAYHQWEKLAEILDIPVEDIYESEENQVFICKDNATGNYYQGTSNYQGTNNTYSIPERIILS